MRTKPRMALITGASSGLGRAFAEALPEATGLLLTGRDQQALEEVVGTLARPGRTVAKQAADLASDRGRDVVIKRAEELGVDLLVNNAGIGRLGRFLDHAAEEERRIVELNVTAPLVLSRALLPGMIDRARVEQRRAGLILVSSEAAFAPVPYFASYAASKAFELVLAESLAEELRGEPVDVLALCPGSMRTQFGRRAGYEAGNLPGAADPSAVAREALAGLGRHTVLVSGFARRTVLAPVWLPRRFAARGLGTAMSWFWHWQGWQPGDDAARHQRGTRPQ